MVCTWLHRYEQESAEGEVIFVCWNPPIHPQLQTTVHSPKGSWLREMVYSQGKLVCKDRAHLAWSEDVAVPWYELHSSCKLHLSR